MTFDLEKARDVCAGMERFRGQTIQCTHIEAHLAAAMLPEALAEIERLRAREAGLEQRLEWTIKNFVKERDEEVQRQAARIKELEEALVEERADRLRPYEKVAADLQACGSYVGIGPGEGDLPIPERVRRTVNRLNGSIGHYEQRLIAKDARIKELEDALVEYQRLGKTISEVVVPCLTAHGNCDQCRPKANAACDAIETIRKGKIGSGDHIGEPNKLIWQITDERKAALNRAYDIVAWADRNSSPENRAHIATILAMLEEARP